MWFDVLLKSLRGKYVFDFEELYYVRMVCGGIRFFVSFRIKVYVIGILMLMLLGVLIGFFGVEVGWL